MRPDDRRPNLAWSTIGDPEPFDLPLDTGLGSIDDELAEAGTRARRALHGRTQPTRVFSNRLRDQLLGTAVDGAAAFAAAGAALPRESLRGSRRRLEPAGGEAWAPVPLQPRLARRAHAVAPRARWSLLAAAALTAVVVVGALGARFEWLLPVPTSEVSGPPASAGPQTSKPSPASSPAAIAPVVTTDPSKPAETSPPKPSPKPTRKPEATPKPAPTAPPIKPMDLLAKACPGGVVLDWSKPSSSVKHYHVLRSVGGGVPPSYPADGATEVETATSWSAGETDGFDAGLEGGQAATYRAFAFDAEDQVLAFSPSRTVTTVAARDLGPLGVESLGAGTIRVSWGASEVPGACFSYGKLVASSDDPDPSYLKGSPYLTAVGDQATTTVTLDGLPSGETVWLRYELIRVTGTGKFVVGRTDALQVTYP